MSFLGILILVFITIAIVSSIIDSDNANSRQQKEQEEKQELRNKMNEKKAEHEQKIKALSEKYGNCSVDIPITKYWRGGGVYFHLIYISVFEKTSIVVINDVEYPFSDILGFSLVDDATSETITTSTGEAKTSTGSMLGRAVVGGVLTGGLGAVAGAATARKNIATNATSQTTTTHNYALYINVNSLKSPTITIPIGEDTQKAHELANLFNVIIAKGQG